MIALSVAKLKMLTLESEIFLRIKPKKRKKKHFVESLDQRRRLEVREKARNVFCDDPTCLITLRCYTTSNLHQVLFRFRFFRSYFELQNFWRLRNLIKQLFHSHLLDMRLVIANSALRASLAIYNLISNARS